MSIESNGSFGALGDMPRNRKSQASATALAVAKPVSFFGLVALAWWMLTPGQESGLVGLFVGGVLVIGSACLGTRAAMIGRER